jgi:hypothetical protein
MNAKVIKVIKEFSLTAVIYAEVMYMVSFFLFGG